jgi:hypothetical protein
MNKFLSKDTVSKLQKLSTIKSRISKTSKSNAKKMLMKTGIYETNGKLKSAYR